MEADRMDSFSTAFSRELAKRIKEASDRETDAITSGLAITDIASYREKVGRLYAYKQIVTDFMVEIEHDLNNQQ